MKFKGIYKPKKEKKEKQEKKKNWYLALEEDCGCIDLVAVDKNGERIDQGFIAGFDPENGELVLYSVINDNLGISQNEDGSIKTVKDMG